MGAPFLAISEDHLRPRPCAGTESHDRFRNRLQNRLDPRHARVRLAGTLDWSRFDEIFGVRYGPDRGSPGQPTRGMVGRESLQPVYPLSDEAVVAGWVENPYGQSFCGEEYCPPHPPIDPSRRTRCRPRIGTAGAEWVLPATIDAGLTSGTGKPRAWRRVTVDTTVPDQAVTFPTDGQRWNRSRVRRVKRCPRYEGKWCQRDARKGPPALLRSNRVAHARQLRRMNRPVKSLRTDLGRVVRDRERNTAGRPDREPAFADERAMARRVRAPEQKGRNQRSRRQAPDVECIRKGKAHRRYEFGVQGSMATPHRSHFLLGGMARAGNPDDGPPRKPALDPVRRRTGRSMDEVFVDRGYRGHGEGEASGSRPGPRRGLVTRRRKQCRQRQAMEPVIGHRKSDGHPGRNGLPGREGDRRKVRRCGAGHHRRRTRRPLRFLGRGIGGLGGRSCDVLRARERPGTTGRWKLPASELGSVPPWALAAT